MASDYASDPDLVAAKQKAAQQVSEFLSNVDAVVDRTAANAVPPTPADVLDIKGNKVVKLSAVVMQVHLVSARIITQVLPAYWRAILASLVQNAASKVAKWAAIIGVARWIDVSDILDLVTKGANLVVEVNVQKDLEARIRKEFKKAREELESKGTLKQTSKREMVVGVYSRHPLGKKIRRRPHGL